MQSSRFVDSLNLHPGFAVCIGGCGRPLDSKGTGWGGETNLHPVRHLAESNHPQCYAELGWVNLPNIVLSNLYGASKHLHLNNLGFRGRERVDAEVVPMVCRIILSGDSGTFGCGVGDELAWGAGLVGFQSHDPALVYLPVGKTMTTRNLTIGGLGCATTCGAESKFIFDLVEDLRRVPKEYITDFFIKGSSI